MMVPGGSQVWLDVGKDTQDYDKTMYHPHLVLLRLNSLRWEEQVTMYNKRMRRRIEEKQ